MTPESIGCDIDYIYEPITPYRKETFSFLKKHIPENATVLDLGCGAVGFYWATQYLEKARSISFADCSQDMIDTLTSRMDALTPETMIHDFPGMDQDFRQLLPMLHQKTEDILILDALYPEQVTSKKYDAVIAIELLECANTASEFLTMIETCRNLLNPGGRLIGCCLDYKEWTGSLESLSRLRMAGKYNPSPEKISAALTAKGLRIIEEKSAETGMENHPTVRFFCAENPA